MLDITNELRDGIGMIRDKSMILEDRVKIALDLVDFITLKFGISLEAIDEVTKAPGSVRQLIKDSIITFIFSEDEEEKDMVESGMIEYFGLIAKKIKDCE